MTYRAVESALAAVELQVLCRALGQWEDGRGLGQHVRKAGRPEGDPPEGRVGGVNACGGGFRVRQGGFSIDKVDSASKKTSWRGQRLWGGSKVNADEKFTIL